MMATFYHDVPVTAHRLLDRPKGNIDYRNTYTYIWDLPGTDTRGCTGQPIPLGCRQDCSIQCNGPMILLGSNDEIEWFEVVRAEKAGIFAIPRVVRAIKPVVPKDQKTRIVLFIHSE